MENDFPIRMAGGALGLRKEQLRGLTPSEVTRRLRYQEAFPQT
jgi:hypothetical protein